MVKDQEIDKEISIDIEKHVKVTKVVDDIKMVVEVIDKIAAKVVIKTNTEKVDQVIEENEKVHVIINGIKILV